MTGAAPDRGRVAVIGGGGRLPGLLLEALEAAGADPVPAEMAGFPFEGAGTRTVERFRIERLVPFLERLRALGVTRVAMAGRISRPALDPAALDPATAALVPKLMAAMAAGDDTTLRAVVAVIEAAGGVEVLEQLAAADAAAAQAAAEAAAMAQAQAEAEAEAAAAAAADAAQRPRLSPIETNLVALLEKNGPILGTAEVGYALWPDRDMQPQGAAIAVGGILRRMLDRGYIESILVDHRRSYAVTECGRTAREQDRIDAIDPRQLTLLEH